jgi:competence protein ComEC
MNGYIERMEEVSFSVWEGLSLSAVQALLLLLFIAAVSLWLLERQRAGLWAGLTALALFTTLRTVSFLRAAQQQQLIVYNIPKRQAIDVFDGRNGWFIGDGALHENDPVIRLHLQPSRNAHRIARMAPLKTKAFRLGNTRILILDTTIAPQTFSKPYIDVLILSRNPKLYLKELLPHLAVSQVVIDASVPPWKAARWQQDCAALRVPCHSVVQKGAFVMPVSRPTFAAP